MDANRMARRGFVAGALGMVVAACEPVTPSDGNGPSAARDSPLLAVKIDNVGAARPQTGVEHADIIYVEQVEGGLSRLMAVFGSTLPDVIGPVRSARETDLELLRQFGDPTLAYSGAQGRLRPLIDAAPLRARPAGGASGAAYFRGSEKPAPHNLFLRPAKLGRLATGTNAGDAAGFRFAARVPEGGRPETARAVRFPSARFAFDWSASRRRWLVSMDGRAAVTSGGTRLSAATAVVQYVDVEDSRFHDKFGAASPLSRTVGSGRAVVLRDGRAYEARWQRPTATDGTEFTADGQPLAFAPGPVWVVFAKR